MADGQHGHWRGGLLVEVTSITDLTDEQKRVKIAEVCGWKIHYSGDGFGYNPTYCTDGNYKRLPDYLNDLNAMHEAEKVLDASQWESYNDTLRELILEQNEIRGSHGSTARQRADAFLLCLHHDQPNRTHTTSDAMSDAYKAHDAMTTVYKYQLILTDKQTIQMPEHAQVLCVQMQYGLPTLWAQVFTGAGAQLRTFEIFGTGHEMDGASRVYIGTVQVPNERAVLHVFERLTS